MATMNALLEKLLILQDRDARLARLKAEQARIPIEQATLDQQSKSATEAVEQAKTDGKRIEADRKKLEMDANSKEDLVRKYKGQLLEIKNNDQFHALQHEIVMAEEEIRKIEDRELELMEKYEGALMALKHAEGHKKDILQSLEGQQTTLRNKAVAIEKQVSALQAERAILAGEIEESPLSRYERIFRSKNGQAIVRIHNGGCTGCHLKLTAQEIHHAQSGEEMVACTNCGRLLYWSPE